MKLNVFQKMSSYVKKFFKTEEMQKIVSYPLLFLGTSPYDALAIYSIMSHVDFNQ
jgi:phytoene desaturase